MDEETEPPLDTDDFEDWLSDQDHIELEDAEEEFNKFDFYEPD